MNKVFLSGALRYPRTTEKDGKIIVRFSIGVSSKYNEKWTTHWFDVVCFHWLADKIKDVPIKTRVFVVGELNNYYLENLDGSKRIKTTIIAENVELVQVINGNENENGDAKTKTDTKTEKAKSKKQTKTKKEPKIKKEVEKKAKDEIENIDQDNFNWLPF